MRRIIKKLIALSLTVICITNCILQVEAQSVQAENPMTAEEKIATIQNPIDTDEGKVVSSYLYFGSYPQSEVTGEALTSAIINADYDENGDGVVNGQKYRRVCEEDAYYTLDKHMESEYGGEAFDDYREDLRMRLQQDFFDWSDGKYHYFKYEPIKWQVYSVSSGEAVLVADSILDHRSYSEYRILTRWDMTSIRCWLNGYASVSEEDATEYEKNNFINTAFLENEQQGIVDTIIMQSASEEAGVAACDKVVLAIDDIVGTFNQKERIKTLSDYAIAMGMQSDRAQWWTMAAYNKDLSYGARSNCVVYVLESGVIYDDFYEECDMGGSNFRAYANAKMIGVAPRITLDLTQTDLWMTEEEYEEKQGLNYELFQIENGELKYINSWPEENTEKLETEFVLPDTIERTGSYLFDKYWQKIKKLVLPESLKTIGEHSFYQKKIENLVFAEGLQTIEKSAFAGSLIQNTYTLPSTLETIGENAFRNSKQPNFILPDSVKRIEGNAFEGMYSISKIETAAASGSALDAKYTKWDCMYIPENIEYFGKECFDKHVVLIGVKGSKAEMFIKANGYRGIFLDTVEECRELEQYFIEGRKYHVFDVNRDNNTDLTDANEVLKASLGIESEEQTDFVKQDADMSGVVDLNDANVVLKYALGIEE